MVDRIVLTKDEAIEQLLDLQKYLSRKSISEKSLKSDYTNTIIHIDNLVSLLHCCNIEKVYFFCAASNANDIRKICKKDTIALHFPGGYLFWREFIGII